ncbi:MAG: Rrf2 family transcriptional regulator [Sphingobacteriaceae bacterium]|nr:Rrf2 family transcriptional regulator [Sphingobacteriaceae bacterium]
MLTKRVKYALKALVFIHKNEQHAPIPAKTIAAQEGIPFKFLENILRELKQAKILSSDRGPKGGYYLVKSAHEISIAEIMRIIDGPIALIPCASENFYQKCVECTDEKTCRIRKLFSELRENMLPILSKSLLEFAEY